MADAVEEEVVVYDEGLDEHRDCGGDAGEERYDVEAADDIEHNVSRPENLGFESHGDRFSRN